MTENKKVSPEMLSNLVAIQAAYTKYITMLGEIRYQTLMLRKQEEDVQEKMFKLEAERQQYSTQLAAEFGANGIVNIETGEFVPARD